MNEIHVYGAGLAGCEAAYQAAKRGAQVRLYEMKPIQYTPAHSSSLFAELVCSNSLRSNAVYNAVGLLKEELRQLGSLIMEAADRTRVEAGTALAVDRTKFSAYITDKIKNEKNIEVVTEEAVSLQPDEITVVATGPLTSDKLSTYLQDFIGEDYLHFYDAAAPIVDASSLDYSQMFLQSRYNKGEAAYLNCPMTEEQYAAFYDALIHAQTAQLHDFDENPSVFEGCMPVEIMAKRGYDTLLYGPLKPVGLIDERTGKEPFAAVQLRAENEARTMYNMVGFQTHLTFPEQRRVLSLIPGLAHAEFLRYGVMHRNTFLNSPKILSDDYSMRRNGNIFFAGQITGVEGYVESCASGFVSGVNAVQRLTGGEKIIFSDISVIGAMAKYVSSSNAADFQPMNANFGIVVPPEIKIKGGKRMRIDYMARRSLEYIEQLTKEMKGTDKGYESNT